MNKYCNLFNPIANLFEMFNLFKMYNCHFLFRSNLCIILSSAAVTVNMQHYNNDGMMRCNSTAAVCSTAVCLKNDAAPQLFSH